MFGKAIVRGLVAVTVAAFAVVAQAVTIETVPVGNPGNAGEWSGESYGGVGPDRICGGVNYNYQIGKFEVTAGQYTQFLNAVGKSDDCNVLYNPAMADPINAKGCNIQRTGNKGDYSYSVAADWANRPVNYVSWGDAARFANWLTNGQPSGTPGLLTTEDGSYYLNGTTLLAVTRKTVEQGARYVIPNEDEWYKAAYYDPNKPGGAGYWDYPTKTDLPPLNTLLSSDPGNHANFYDANGTGNHGYTLDSPYYRTEGGAFTDSASPYGTLDQGGNVCEWDETLVQGPQWTHRGVRGGSFDSGSYALAACDRSYGDSPSDETYYLGFRVGLVPEPSSITLLLAAAASLFAYAWRRRRQMA